MTLLAHHIEAHHVPVLLCLFATGVYVGWELLGRLLARPRPSSAESPASAPK
jgi:hypothetical protein